MEFKLASPARCLCGQGLFGVVMCVVGDSGRAIIKCAGCGDVFLVADGQDPVLLESAGRPVSAV